MIPKLKTIFATLEPNDLMHFRLNMVRKEGYKHKVGDITIKLTLSCVMLDCTKYPTPRLHSVTGWEPSTVLTQSLN